MTLKQTITEQMKQAMRAHAALQLDTLRFVLSQLKYKEIELRRELTETEVTDVLASEVKKRREAIKLFGDSGRTQLVEEEEAKLATITSLLPAELTRSEIEVLVAAAIAKVGNANMGAVMKELMPQVKGRSDGALVSEIVKVKLAAL